MVPPWARGGTKRDQDQGLPAQAMLLRYQPHEEPMRAAGEEEAEATGSRPPASVSSLRCSFLGVWG